MVFAYANEASDLFAGGHIILSFSSNWRVLSINAFSLPAKSTLWMALRMQREHYSVRPGQDRTWQMTTLCGPNLAYSLFL